MCPQSPRHLNTSVNSIESILHWQKFVQFNLRHVQVTNLSTDSWWSLFSVRTAERWSSFLSQSWPIGDKCQGWSLELSSIYRPDNLHVGNLGSTHPFLVATDLLWRIFQTELSISCFVYICFIWHSIKMTKQFFKYIFEIHLRCFSLYLPVGIHFANAFPSFEQYSTTLLFLVHWQH